MVLAIFSPYASLTLRPAAAGALPRLAGCLRPGGRFFCSLLLVGLSIFVVVAFVECKEEWLGDVFYLLLLVISF